VIKLEDVLTKPQLAYLRRRRAEVVPPPGSAYHFTFKEVPGYEEVTVYYLMATVKEAGQTRRRLAAHPSAMTYLLHVSRPGDLARHLDGDDFLKVSKQLLAAKASQGRDMTVRIQRTLFDIGGAPPSAFFENRETYYNFQIGRPIFGDWPEAFRRAAGRFTVSLEHASLTRGGTHRVKVIEGKQYFGYTFPVLGELLTGKQKDELENFVGRANPEHGAASVVVNDLKNLGEVTLHYVERDGKLLSHPSAMTSVVKLSAKRIRKEPFTLQKYLTPEGVAHLRKQVREGERTGRKLDGVEILRMHFDVVTKTEPDARKVHDEFKRDVGRYSHRGVLVRPDKWPEKFRRPDGLFDVERTLVRVTWRVRR